MSTETTPNVAEEHIEGSWDFAMTPKQLAFERERDKRLPVKRRLFLK